jgi:hypothetical protein
VLGALGEAPPSDARAVGGLLVRTTRFAFSVVTWLPRTEVFQWLLQAPSPSDPGAEGRLPSLSRNVVIVPERAGGRGCGSG